MQPKSKYMPTINQILRAKNRRREAKLWIRGIVAVAGLTVVTIFFR